MYKGNVKWFHNQKGFGFLECTELTDDIFFHFSVIDLKGYKTIKNGQPVSFETMESERGLRATRVRAEQ